MGAERTDFYQMVKKWTEYDHKTPGLKAEIIIDMLISEFVCDIVKYGLELDHKFVLLAKEYPIKTLTEDPGNKATYRFSYLKDKDDKDKNKEEEMISNRNAKVDFLLLDQDAKEVYLTELKTTRESFEVKQLLQMRFAAKQGIEESIEFYKRVKKTSDQKKKYEFQSDEIIKAFGIKDIDDVKKYGIRRINCLYLSLDRFDQVRPYEGARIMDRQGNPVFEMDGFEIKPCNEKKQDIVFKDGTTIPVILFRDFKLEDDNEKAWAKVSEILNKLI